MNEDIKRQWVAALRSGDYQQGRGTLHTRDGKYCCLGVLCELAVEAGIAVQTASRYYQAANGQLDQSCTVLPEAVRDWAGLSTSNPLIPTGNGCYSGLAIFNDGEDYLYNAETNRVVPIGPHTFNDIANLIEEHL